MAETGDSPRRLLYPTSSSLESVPRSTGFSSVRSRNRRHLKPNFQRGEDAVEVSIQDTESTSFSKSVRAGNSPRSSPRSSANPIPKTSSASLGQFFGDTLTRSLSSVQELTSFLLSGQEDRNRTIRPQSSYRDDRSPESTSTGLRQWSSDKSRKNNSQWGPSPPLRVSEPIDVGRGSSTSRRAALMAAKTASVLESHDGVNGGLDVAGKFKRRTSEEITVDLSQSEDYLVYIHRVKPTDTYAGLILRYKCSEHVFRKANGLWSRDSFQIRKWLTVPVDSCDLRGNACDPPTEDINSTRASPPGSSSPRNSGAPWLHDSHNDFLNKSNAWGAHLRGDPEREEKPWAHVRWVKIDSISEPVEIGRVSRQAMGYFPPRRKKGSRTGSSFSTPRQSFDLSNSEPGFIERSLAWRESFQGSQPLLPGSPESSHNPVDNETMPLRPRWMQRPGGVGSMGRNTRLPGPDKDYFNSWAKKHLPSLNISDLPSMSVMGSETAHVGFSREATEIAENPFEEAQITASLSRQGNGFDKAASAIETWLRGALAKRPATPLLGAIAWQGSKPVESHDGDLIELADATSDDQCFSKSPLNRHASSSSSKSQEGREGIDGLEH